MEKTGFSSVFALKQFIIIFYQYTYQYTYI